MGKCRVCGKALPYKADKCGECAKKSLQALFKENPELKKAFKETVEELKKPENIKKMADDTCKFMAKMQDVMKLPPEERNKLIAKYQQQSIGKD